MSVTTIAVPKVSGFDAAEQATAPVWWTIPTEPTVFLRCNCGRFTHLADWEISADGMVSPSYWHVEPHCAWHVFLRLLDWRKEDV